jgi:hypothetical protein
LRLNPHQRVSLLKEGYEEAKNHPLFKW